MSNDKLDKVFYIDDSSDEIFLTNILFNKQKIELEVVHCVDFQSFQSEMDGCSPIDDRYKFIVVDLNLPTMRGTELIRLMLADQRSDHWIMGICTGSEDPADKRNAFRAGARFCVSKPLDADCLKAICDQVTSLKLRESTSGGLELVNVA